MKKCSAVVLTLSLLIAIAICGAVFASDLSDAGTRGARLFKDPALGTNGKSCATCHEDGKVWAGKARFPKVAVGGLHTLDQAIQICISNALGGKPLAWDDPRLTDLAVFIDAAYVPKK